MRWWLTLGNLGRVCVVRLALIWKIGSATPYGYPILSTSLCFLLLLLFATFALRYSSSLSETDPSERLPKHTPHSALTLRTAIGISLRVYINICILIVLRSRILRILRILVAINMRIN